MGGGDSWDSIAFFNYPNTNPPEVTIAPILQEKTLESEGQVICPRPHGKYVGSGI